jgi:hypothetical protein
MRAPGATPSVLERGSIEMLHWCSTRPASPLFMRAPRATPSLGGGRWSSGLREKSKHLRIERTWNGAAEALDPGTVTMAALLATRDG